MTSFSAPAGAVPVSAPLLAADCVLVSGGWAALKPAARAVRHAVFVIEQQIAIELEWDEWDDSSLHAVVFDGQQQALGTGRLLPARFDPDSPHTGHIGRMAVLAAARRSGVGGAILQALMQAAAAQGFADIVLHAQSYVAPFYARHGYLSEGAEFVEAGILHRQMRATLARGGSPPAHGGDPRNSAPPPAGTVPTQ